MRKVVVGLAAALLPLGLSSVGDGAEAGDPCQAEALRAYFQAVKLCQLAENPNPRLRCYEAARGVYFHVLQECRSEHGGSNHSGTNLAPEPPPPAN